MERAATALLLLLAGTCLAEDSNPMPKIAASRRQTDLEREVKQLREENKTIQASRDQMLRQLSSEVDTVLEQRDAARLEARSLKERVDKLEMQKEQFKRAYTRIWAATRRIREKVADNSIELEDFKEVDRSFAFLMADLAESEDLYNKRVLLVNTEGTVWVHFGTDDGVTVGSRFAVYDLQKGKVPDGKIGVIEVTHVLRDNLSEAKILKKGGSFGIGLGEILERLPPDMSPTNEQHSENTKN